jgi:superfamily II DNA or RNA helicase
MSPLYPFCEQIKLHVPGRITKEDAYRQEATSREILRRLKDQAGIVLADEVGMGKTFVALAVAISAVLGSKDHLPAVVMVPPSLHKKWPQDFETFRAHCLAPEIRERVSCGVATRAVAFLKLLDDPPERRKTIIFVTHGAMSRGLMDKWVKLSLIWQALNYRHGTEDLKRKLCKIMGGLLRISWMDRKYGEGLWMDLLKNHPSTWLKVLHRWEVDLDADDDPTNDDDPVPQAILNLLKRLNTNSLYEKLYMIPKKKSASFDKRLDDARKSIHDEIRSIWTQCIQHMQFHLPLLILDEAHHLKNEFTQLASLFRCQDAKDDVEEIRRGALNGVFERMLFLTATPFQLGHGELCSVIERFDGIDWNSPVAPQGGREGFLVKVSELRKGLDSAQESALRLDDAWGRLRSEDLMICEEAYADTDRWWECVQSATSLSSQTERVLHCYRLAEERMRAAEHILKPWVIRHLKPRVLPEPYQGEPRRKKFPGRSIIDGILLSPVIGLPVTDDSLAPFLLAARATTCAPNCRSVFAEGLASSYEAFLNTRKSTQRNESVEDIDADGLDEKPIDEGSLHWYLEHLSSIIPHGDVNASLAHPKIAATVDRVVREWSHGEKVLVFCHFIATGKTLRLGISHAIRKKIAEQGMAKLGCSEEDVFDTLDRIGRRFFDEDSPARRFCDDEITKMLEGYSGLSEHKGQIQEVVRRMIRTPSFLVRFFSLQDGKIDDAALGEAFNRIDQSDMTLRKLLQGFFSFLEQRSESRQAFIDAVSKIQTGEHFVKSTYSDDEAQGENPSLLIPNVRLVNGTTRQDTRQRLMLAFNTPFFPEVLVASSVMAEGVDLHLNCRYVIHHDLCWNPSTLEQRTGRVDRVGAKAEQCGKAIYIYLPYISETQDEKMYRVVMDRERWFSVVMGEKFDISAATTDKLASRIPLPETLARQLAFRLEAKD